MDLDTGSAAWAVITDYRGWFLSTSFDVEIFANKGATWCDRLGNRILFTVRIHGNRHCTMIPDRFAAIFDQTRTQMRNVNFEPNNGSRKCATSWKYKYII